MQPKEVHISGDLSALNGQEITLANIPNNFLDTLSIVDGKVNHTLEINEPFIAYLTAGKIRDYIYLEPGQDMTLSYDPILPQLSYSGQGSAENNLLSEMGRMITETSQKNPIFTLASEKEAAFLLKVEEKYAGLSSHLDDNKSQVNSKLYNILSKRIKAAKASDMVNYPRYFSYVSKDSQDISDNYYAFLNEIDHNDPELLSFEEGRSLGQALVEKDVDFAEIGSIDKYYQALFDQVGEKFENQVVKDYYSYKYLSDKVNYGGGVDGVEDLITAFYNSTDNDAYISRLKALEAEWVNLKSGLQAPAFDGVTRDGKLVNIADLKGKSVYVDVWATWCGPCIAEIPSLKEVEHDYQGKNVEFVSISIDNQKDRQKWEKFIEEKELGGMQLFANGDWSSDVVKSYNIKGIPRFILIDAQGKIVKADAPRPSNPQLRELFGEIGI
jgi:thiol-disulfide isomerase/thioredoxin